MPHARSLLPFVGLFLAAACGTRSALQVDAATTSTGATASSSEGSGGSPVVAVCDTVNLATPILDLHEPNAEMSQPNLVTVGTAPPSVVLVHVGNAGSPPGKPSVRFGAFDGWGAWPPALPVNQPVGATESAGNIANASLVAVANPSASPPSFAFLYGPGGATGDFESIMFFVPTVELDGTAPLVQGGLAGTALSLAAGAGTGQYLQLTDVWDPDGPYFDISGAIGPSGGYFYGVGCATTPIPADAVPVENGWLFASAFGTKLDWNNKGMVCTSAEFTGSGAASEIEFATIAVGGNPGTLTEVLATKSPVTRIRMAQRAGGAWVVWSQDGAPELEGGLLSTSGVLGTTTFSIPVQGGPIAPTSLALEPLGDTLVVAVAVQASGAGQVELTAVDAGGAAKWTANVPAEGTIDGPLSLRAAPDGSSVLVAWQELPPGAANHRLRIARLDCMGGI